ncbi:MAG: DUF2845 domain-containing protein [Desulfobacteraceae bacterium]|nr:DUF2845 domain-containing protein [Desulfobacteraceae bacterium]
MNAGHTDRFIFKACSLLAVCIALLAAFPAICVSAPECARIGDTVSQVLRNCGEPSSVDSWEERRMVPGRAYDGWYGWGYGIRDVAVPVEEWIYNFGPTHFIRILRFEDGFLREMRTGGYGWRQ